MVKLIKTTLTNDLQELFQATEIKFSFLIKTKEGFEQITTPMKCREYFNEFLMKNHHPKEFKFVATYGFDYDWETSPWDTSTTYMSLQFPSQKLLDTFLQNLPFLHNVEDYNKIPRTQVELTDQSNTLVIMGDSFWNSKCILMNIYTWILKLCSLGIHENDYTKVCTKWSRASEITYLESVQITPFNNVLSNLSTIYKIPTKYVDGTHTINTNMYDIHGYRGILALLTEAKQSLKNEFSKEFDKDFSELFNRLLLSKETPHEFLKAA